jgi:polyisoprenoid-binding protein YceI
VKRLLTVSLALAVLTAGAACAAAPQSTPAPAATPTVGSEVVLPSEAPAPASAAPADVLTFRLVPDESQARFIIDEVLAGSPNTVVGATTAVSGEIIGSFADPTGVHVGPIQVDMSTLRTDNNFRNRALQQAILQTGTEANRVATFEMTSIDGLPDQVEFGTEYPLSMVGNLTLHGVTVPVTFAGKVTAVSDQRLEGTASVTMPYAAFGVQILRLPPQVASVADDVTLEIDFVAVPA